ncbi:MAG: helix-hairpin-helix domain-containing protein [Rubrivivax sp.]|jgi:competence protein ComEA|nr:helix-hairpin-helix domain-containing protein [Rubrivivax sp.]
MLNRFIAAVVAVFSASLLALAAHAATDANKASRAELEAVPGVGPSLSERILDARKTGEFRNWDDLVDRVVGIGPRSADRLSQAGLTVNGSSYKAAGDAAKNAKPAKPAAAADVKPAKPANAAPAAAQR